MDNSDDEEETTLQNWYPRDVLNRTNWLHRLDALRVHDRRELEILWELVELLHHYSTQFVLWAYSLLTILRNPSENLDAPKIRRILDMIVNITNLLWSEGYCYFLDFMEIAYYPLTNRFNRRNNGPRIPPIRSSTIDELGISEAGTMTGFSK